MKHNQNRVIVFIYSVSNLHSVTTLIPRLQVLAYIEEDELVELTPKRITMRKKILDANERKQAARDAKKLKK